MLEAPDKVKETLGSIVDILRASRHINHCYRLDPDSEHGARDMAQAAVETAILSTLASDAAVTQLLGGPNIFGRPAPGQGFPYVTLGRTAVVDWACGRDNDAEDVLTLHVWSGTGGKAATFEIMDKLCGALHDKALPLGDNGVVHLRLQFAEARQQPETPNYHGLLRFLAVRRPLT